MPLTSEDIERIESQPRRSPSRAIRAVIALSRVLGKIPSLRNYIGNTVGGTHGRIFKAWDLNDYERGAQIAIEALCRMRNHRSLLMPAMDHHNWWSIMQDGIVSADQLENADLWRQLVNLADQGPGPFEGYFVSYAYVRFSRWSWKAQMHSDAIRHAEVASRADQSWAEPEYLWGWYELANGSGMPLEHFTRAVEIDARVLSQIMNDVVVQRHQDLVRALHAKYPGVLHPS